MVGVWSTESRHKSALVGSAWQVLGVWGGGGGWGKTVHVCASAPHVMSVVSAKNFCLGKRLLNPIHWLPVSLSAVLQRTQP